MKRLLLVSLVLLSSFVFVFATPEVTVKVGGTPKDYTIAELKIEHMANATAVTLTGVKWTDANLQIFSVAVKGAKTTLQTVDMSSMRMAQREDIQDGFTEMFKGFTALTSMTFPNSASQNDVDLYKTFSGCVNLTNVVNLSNANNISTLDSTFFNCAKLTNLKFSTSGRQSISMVGAFAGCTGLTTITNLRSFIGITSLENAFLGCTSLPSLAFSSNTNASNAHISLKNAFSGCTSLTAITGLNQITNIASLDNAFSGCTSLTELTFSAHDRANNSLVSMLGAFSGCTSLETINNLDKFSDITALENAFNGCSALTTLKFSDIYWANTNALSMEGAFSGCTKLETITNLRNFNTICSLKGAFYGCSSLKELTFADKWWDNNAPISLEDAFRGCTSLTTITNLSTFTAMTSLKNAFRGCSALTSPTFSSSSWTNTTAISMEGAFSGCTSLIAVNHLDMFPNVISIDSAFFNCTALPSLTFSTKGNQSISMQAAFKGCTALKTITNLDMFEAITALNQAFSGCTSLTTLAFSSSESASNAQISMKEAFEGCTSLTAIAGLNQITYITNLENAFANCTSLTSLTFSQAARANNAPISMAGAFRNCAQLSSIIQLENISNITALNQAFLGCTSLTSLTFSQAARANNANISMEDAFSGCTKLASITNLNNFPNIINLTSTFANCKALKEIRLGKNPNDLDQAVLANTFEGLTEPCLKYLPSTTTVPTEWENYINFVLPFTIEIQTPSSIAEFTPLMLPSFTVTPPYAASKDTVWQISKDGKFTTDLEAFAKEKQLDFSYNGAKLRRAAKSYLSEDSIMSNLVDITINRGNSVTVIIGSTEHYYPLAGLTNELANATSITLNGAWSDVDMQTFKTAIAGAKSTLTMVDMSTVTFAADGDIDFSSLFTDFKLLTEVTLPTAPTANATSMASTFSGCTSLTAINNLDKFTNITDLTNTFADCSALKEVRLGTDPNNLDSTKIVSTFAGANQNYIKYLPTAVITIPTAWESYTNFTVPIISIGEITAPAIIKELEALTLPVVTIVPAYAAQQESKWQISKDGSFTKDNIETYTAGQLLDFSYNEASLRYATKAHWSNIFLTSNTVKISISEGNSVAAVIAGTTHYFPIDETLATNLVGATSVTLKATLLNTSDMGIFKIAIAGAKTTLTMVDMSTVTFAVEGDIDFDSLFIGFNLLTKVSLPTAPSAYATSMNATFSGCKALTTINNLDKFTNITDLTSTFANCVALTEVRLAIDATTLETLQLAGKLATTFDGTNQECVKYIPIDIKTLPTAWSTYTNFALPFVIESITPLTSIEEFTALTLPTVAINPIYAAQKDSKWEISKTNNSFETTEQYIAGQTLDNSYSASYLRYSAQPYTNTEFVHSDGVEITVNVGTSITAIIGGATHSYALAGLATKPEALLGATSVTLKGALDATLMPIFKTAIAGATGTLNTVDMSEVTFAVEGDIDFDSLFIGFNLLTKVSLPTAPSAYATSMNATFSGCTLLTTITNLELFTNITDLTNTFANCAALTEVRLGTDPNTAELPIVSTFTGTNLECVKYLPIDITVPASWWQDAKYTNFAIPIISIEDIIAPASIDEFTALTLPVVTIVLTYAAQAESKWEISKDGKFVTDTETYTAGQTLDITYSGAHLRYAAKAYGATEFVTSTNNVVITIADDNTVVYTNSEGTTTVKLDALAVDKLLDATSITLSGKDWDSADMQAITTEMNKASRTLTTVDMSTVTLSDEVDFSSRFENCITLTTLTLPTAETTHATSMSATFSGCTQLTTINNLEKFTSITDLTSTFANCVALTEVRLGIDAPTLETLQSTGKLATTFEGTTISCVKYIPTDIVTLPAAWSAYTNFALPFTVATASDPIIIDEFKALTLPSVTIDPTNAAHKDSKWEISKDGTFGTDKETYTVGQTLDITYNGAKLRYVAKSYVNEDLIASEPVMITINAGNSVTAIIDNKEHYYQLAGLTNELASATSVILKATLLSADDIATFKAAIAEAKSTLTYVDMSTVTFATEGDIDLNSLFGGLAVLKAVTLPTTANATSMSATFNGCTTLTTIANLENFTNITDLTNTFAHCEALTEVRLGIDVTKLNALQTAGKLATTFEGTNPKCIKYLSADITTIPEAWNNYRNFALSFKVTITPPANIEENAPLVLPEPTIDPIHAAHKEGQWEISKDGFSTDTETYAAGDKLDITYNGASLRYTAKSYLNETPIASDLVKITINVNATNTVTATATVGEAEVTTSYTFDQLTPQRLLGATTITLNGAWGNSHIGIFKEAIKVASTTLTSVTMTELTLVSDVDINSTFKDFNFLTTVTLPTATTAHAITMNATFSGCTSLTAITNLENFTTITDLTNTFAHCADLTEVHLGTDPNNVDKVVGTFDNATTALSCIKYLPSGVVSIPEVWQTANYTNFALPISIANIPDIPLILEDTSLELPAVPAITPSYAAYQNAEWQISEDNITFTSFANDAPLDITYNGKYIRYAATSYLTGATFTGSNAVQLDIIEQGDNTVTVTIGAETATEYALSELVVANLIGATAITLNGTWNDANMTTFTTVFKDKAAATASTLTAVDMSTVTFVSTINFNNLFENYAKLTTVTLPTVKTKHVVTISATFSDCAALTTIPNLENFSNITDLTNAFANCTVLTEVRLGTDPNNLDSIKGTFDNTNQECIKYLPSGVLSIPTEWQSYTNFALPISITNIPDIPLIVAGTPLVLPAVPTIEPSYAARKEGQWQISDDGINNFITFTSDEALGIRYNGKYIRYAAKSYVNGEDFTGSNAVQLEVTAFEHLSIVINNEYSYSLAQLTDNSAHLSKAISVALKGTWSDKDMEIFNTAIKTAKTGAVSNLNSVDMSEVKFTSPVVLSSLFEGLTALKNVTLPTAETKYAVSMVSTFSGCTMLTTIENLENFTNITDLTNTFANCAALTEIHLGIDPNNATLFGKLDGTFTNTTVCLKYLPTNVKDIPTVWSTYSNFTLPITEIAGISVMSILFFAGDSLYLPAIPVATPTYAAQKVGQWQISKGNDLFEAIEIYTQGDELSISYGGSYLRYAVQSYSSDVRLKTSTALTVSNAVPLKVVAAGENTVSFTHANSPHFTIVTLADLDNSPNRLSNAKSIILNGTWSNSDMDIFKRAIESGVQSSLTTIEMKDLTFESSINLDNLFKDYPELTTVTLPTAETTHEISMVSTFNDCTKLSAIANLEHFTNIANLTNTFANCAALTEIHLGIDPKNVASKATTFEGLTEPCLKYLPTGITNIPSEWDSYRHFVLPIIGVTIADLDPIKVNTALTLPSVDVNPIHAAQKVHKWVIYKDSKIIEYTEGAPLGIEYDGSSLCYTVQSYLSEAFVLSNLVKIKIQDKTDLRVNGGENITSDNITFGTITIEPNGKLTLSENVTVDKLILKSSQTETYSLAMTKSVSVTEMEYHKTLDREYFYFFSVPFDCTLDEVITDNPDLGTYGTDWLIKEYDESERATSGAVPAAWKEMTSGESLDHLTGYVAVLSLETEGEKDLVFRKTYASPYPLNERQSATVTATAAEGGLTVHKGWNLISVPHFAEGTIHLHIINEADPIIKVNIPNVHGTDGYIQGLSSEVTLYPSQSFFIQAATNSKVIFTTSEPSFAPQRTKVLNNNVFSISDKVGNSDKATLVFNADAPKDEYYIMHDLLKMASYTSSPLIFINDHDSRLVYSAINAKDYSQISLGVWVPEAGDYTLHFEQSSKMYIFDAITQTPINVDSYSFHADARGSIENRFIIHLNQLPTDDEIVSSLDDALVLSTKDGITVENLPEGSSVSIHTAAGALVFEQQVVENIFSVNSLPAGVYMLTIKDGSVQKTHKVTVK